MAMWTIIAKNAGLTDVLVDDLGVYIPAEDQYTLSDSFTFDEIACSDSLRTLVLAETLVINNGSSDLTASKGVAYLTLLTLNGGTLTSPLSYSGTPSGSNELVTKGYADSIAAGFDPKKSVRTCTTVALPACTYNNGTDGVGATLTGDVNGALPTISGVTVVSTNRILVKNQSDQKQNGIYDVTTVGDVDTKFVLTRSVDFDNSPVGEVTGGAFTFVETGDKAGSSWVLIYDGSPTFGTHNIVFTQSGGSDAFAALQTEVNNIEAAVSLNDDGTFIAWSGTNYLDATTTIKGGITALDGALDTVSDNLGTHTSSTSNPHQTTLDQAYDGSGAGAGKSITADQGPVTIGASGGYAPLQLTSLGSAPNTGLANGQVAVINGIFYNYDATRSKWLSVERIQVMFCKAGTTIKNEYLFHFGSGIASNLSGQRIARNATIVSMTGQLNASGTCDISLRKNGTVTDISTLSISAALGNQVTNTDVDLSAGDRLHAYISNSSSVSNPVFIAEIAYRA